LTLATGRGGVLLAVSATGRFEMKNSYRRLLPGLAVALGLTMAAAEGTQAQEVIDACYMQKTGVIYRIDPSGTLPGGLRAKCVNEDKHVRFQWERQSVPGMLGAVTFATDVAQIRPPTVGFAELLTTSFTTTVDGPAVISFYANAAQLSGPLAGDTGLLFRLMVDGTEVVAGNRMRNDFESDQRDAQMYGFDWAVNLKAGAHTISVEWLGLCGAGGTPCATMDSRSLIVRYAH
jgi:hypothetical protein